MTLSVVKSKRKVSCLPCRYRKVKCCGGHPCQRCILRKAPDDCTFLKPGQVGRRPRNAVVNKLVLNRSKQTTSGNQYKEFIFENVCYSMPTDAIFINNDSSKNLYYFIHTLFNYDDAIMQLAVSRVTKALPYIPEVKMYELLDLHVYATVELLNVVVNRISALPLDSFSFFDSISASVFQDMALKFFSEPPPTLPSINPLSTLSPHKAVYLIDTFFTVNPNSILLNQTLILQGYWTDSIDPLLLCVILGTSTYMEKMTKGQPLGLWEASDQMIRNPFLEYAYILVQKSSSEVSLEKYQAVVLLGLFEMVFGFPKRGIVNLGLAFMIGINLGIWDGSFQEKSNDITSELALYSFWSTFNSTCRGVVDLGQLPHYSKKTLSLKLPPANIEQSVSYQFEKSNGNPRRYRSFGFLVESFYTHSVCCKYTTLLLLEFPEVQDCKR
ncbi:hypothetical protein BCR42DRAFT_162199 [Absidia repens]|uniref:Zn(2)-C6 fungal-type domain-containing protein n=1 Tax=Absidia repens TaxID=90262 RepID=A0A1X2ITF6_9FUNG|nr:hypothetical protein BCR42DRAFT_162199 [Absidia repens]